MLPQVAPLRDSSRRVVRELGFMSDRYQTTGVSHAQCHALLELETRGQLAGGELAATLMIDKSTASRLLHALAERGWARQRVDPADARRKLWHLTEAGRTKVVAVHLQANGQVGEALSLLGEAERSAVVDGMQLYAKALRRRRLQAAFTVRSITHDDAPQVAAIIRAVMPEFGADGPGFALHDPEVDHMDRAYGVPGARYYVIERGGRVLGGGGVAALEGAGAGTCELRKMYFLPEVRGLGLGARMLSTCLEAARELGYERCYLETLESMRAAQRLYRAFGFKQLDGPEGATGHFGCDAWYARGL